MTHTPGPWTAGENGVFANGFQTVIATTWGVGGPADRATNDANARLIAAAPDMLAALKVAEGHLEKAAAGMPPIHYTAHDLRTVRDAIAKAEGR